MFILISIIFIITVPMILTAAIVSIYKTREIDDLEETLNQNINKSIQYLNLSSQLQEEIKRLEKENKRFKTIIDSQRNKEIKIKELAEEWSR